MFDEFLNSFQMEPGIWPICLRLLCAMLVGMVIGTEREYTNRPAGMRTHILVALGACVVALTGQMLRGEYGNADPARLAAQVITGVGFLGAGTIMREGATVKGLTTAASVWSVACLGLAAGFGYYFLALAGMLFIFVALTIFEVIQNKLVKPVKKDYILITSDISTSLTLITNTAQIEKGSVSDITAQTLEDGYRITFRADFGGRHCKDHRRRFFETIATAEGTKSLQLVDQAVHINT
jgi:putative Mg2+ transporter-C (MgtC) family protein